MKALTKTQIKERDKIASDLALKVQDIQANDDLYRKLVLSDVHTTYEPPALSASDRQLKILETKVTSYNVLLEEARDWVAGIVEKIDEYMSDRSDAWQESEKGDAYASWKDEYENFTVDDAVLSSTEPLDFGDDCWNVTETLQDLPEGPDV